MLFSFLAQPLLHGSVGFLDEALVYCLPLLVVMLIIVRTMRRAGQSALERERERKDRNAAATVDHKPPHDAS